MKDTKKKSEQSDDGFKFEMGAMYENMKGVYQVVSIHNDSMVICWNDGSEVVTPVDLQKRILDRMAYEKKLLEQQAVQKREQPQKGKKRKPRKP